MMVERMSESQKDKLRQIRSRFLRPIRFRFACLHRGIKFERLPGGKARFSRAGRSVTVSESDDLLLIARRFDYFFSSEEMRGNGNNLDFTREVVLLGFKVRTRAECALWAKPILLEYNKHSPLKEGDVVLDCGAHHGLYTLIASRAVGETGRVYSFEPDDRNYSILAGNVKRNGLRNVVLVRAGVWKDDGFVSFEGSVDHSYHVSFNPESALGNARAIRVVSLKSFFESEGLSRIDFVKMDIEGAEIEAIGGALDFLSRHPASFAIASYHIRDGKPTCFALEEMFGKAGYDAWTEENSAGEKITHARKSR